MEKNGNKFICFLVMIFSLFMFSSCNQDMNGSLRIRILANSDSEIDQNNKSIVKDALEAVVKNLDDLDIEQIKSHLNNVLNQELASTIQIGITYSNYPAKSYNGKFIPAGEYKTFLIVIGEGKGHNFWTLLYPEFFGVSFEDNNEVQYRSYLLDMLTK